MRSVSRSPGRVQRERVREAERRKARRDLEVVELPAQHLVQGQWQKLRRLPRQLRRPPSSPCQLERRGRIGRARRLDFRKSSMPRIDSLKRIPVRSQRLEMPQGAVKSQAR